MIALIDYDAGNIKSVEKVFQSLGKEVVLTRDPDVLKRADHVVLPGVGSFGDAMENLNRYHLVPVIHEIVEKGTPFLGICLGLQILFERSEESPGVAGLGLFARKVLVWGCDKKYIGKFFTWCLEKGEKGGEKLKAKAGRGLPLALLLFVGIPLPGTGAWTGTLAASILDMDFKTSVLAVMGGVLLASVIMLLASSGVFGAIGALLT